MEKRRSKKKVVITLGILFIGILGASIIFMFTLKTESVPYEDITGKNKLGLLAIKNLTEDNPSFSTYRFADKKEQTFPGTSWNHTFVSPKEAIVYGFHPDNLNTQHFLVLTQREADIKHISELPGQVYTVAQNPEGSYLLISGVTNTTEENPETTYYTCVTEKNVPFFDTCRSVLGDILTEDMYNEQGLDRIFWNRNESRELIIEEMGAEQRFYTFDPWDDHASSTKREDLDILRNEEHEHGSTADQYDISSFSYLTSVRNKNTGNTFRFFSSPATEIFPLPEEHLLLVEGDMSYVLDMKNKKKSEFITLPPKMHREISVY